MKILVCENHTALQLKFKNHLINYIATMYSKVQLVVKFTHYKYCDLIYFYVRKQASCLVVAL